jgi:glycosyltransferase involved in cell wall biosynthesis
VKLNVAHIITQLELGGAQQNTLYTLGHLDRARFTPSLAVGPGGVLDAEALKGNWSTTFITALDRPIHPWRDAKAACQLYKWLRATRPMIVHTHSSKAGILGRLAAYVAGVPVIIHSIHGFGFTPTQKAWVRRLYVAIEKWCARLSTHLIFVSQDNRAEALKLGILPRESDGSLIRSGIDLTPAAAVDIRTELSLARDTWLVTSIGNFKPQKNPLDLVRTAALVIAEEPTVHFILTGDGPLRREAQALAESSGIADHVHFVGWRLDARGILAASDAFILTSLWEGLPRALAEAGAQGLPSVAYAVNGINDILKEGENGFPVAPGNYTMAAEKLIGLKRNPGEARRMGEAAHAAVMREFSIDDMVRQQEKLYADLYDRVPFKNVYGFPTL